MQNQFSLAHLTILGCTPPEMTYIAARSGYDFVSLRLICMGVPGEAECLMIAYISHIMTIARLKRSGVKVPFQCTIENPKNVK